MRKYKKTIAPRLQSGLSRIKVHLALPDEVIEGLNTIAKSEKESRNWVLEQTVLDYFGLKKPKYIERKSHATKSRR